MQKSKLAQMSTEDFFTMYAVFIVIVSILAPQYETTRSSNTALLWLGFWGLSNFVFFIWRNRGVATVKRFLGWCIDLLLFNLLMGTLFYLGVPFIEKSISLTREYDLSLPLTYLVMLISVTLGSFLTLNPVALAMIILKERIIFKKPIKR